MKYQENEVRAGRLKVIPADLAAWPPKVWECLAEIKEIKEIKENTMKYQENEARAGRRKVTAADQACAWKSPGNAAPLSLSEPRLPGRPVSPLADQA